MSFLDDYEPVEDRLAKFWADHPEGQIHTDILPSAEGEFIVKAYVWRKPPLYQLNDDGPVLVNERADATGLAHEVIGQGNVNKTSALENCETSAIGRALANLGYAPKGKRPSREEMAKVEREDPRPTPADWLRNHVAVLKEWTEDERRETVSQVMGELEFTNPMTQSQVEQVYDRCKEIYLEVHPAKDGESF